MRSPPFLLVGGDLLDSRLRPVVEGSASRMHFASKENTGGEMVVVRISMSTRSRALPFFTPSFTGTSSWTLKCSHQSGRDISRRNASIAAQSSPVIVVSSSPAKAARSSRAAPAATSSCARRMNCSRNSGFALAQAPASVRIERGFTSSPSRRCPPRSPCRRRREHAHGSTHGAEAA